MPRALLSGFVSEDGVMKRMDVGDEVRRDNVLEVPEGQFMWARPLLDQQTYALVWAQLSLGMRLGELCSRKRPCGGHAGHLKEDRLVDDAPLRGSRRPSQGRPAG